MGLFTTGIRDGGEIYAGCGIDKISSVTVGYDICGMWEGSRRKWGINDIKSLHLREIETTSPNGIVCTVI